MFVTGRREFRAAQFLGIICRNSKNCFKEALRLAVVLLVGFSVVSAAYGGPYSKLYVFGDSLSDIGNISSATFGSDPGQYYWNNRFSNGPVWVEDLDTGLGLPPLVRSTLSGGTDFAYGGAQTSGTGGLDGIFIKDVDEQINQLLPKSTTKIDSNALYVMFAGANDLINGQTNVNIPVNNLSQDLTRLAAAGAKNFLVANLPPLGYTPRFNGSLTTFNTYNTLTTQFNTALDVMLGNLQAGNAALTIHRLDVESLFSQAIANPAAFGLTNVSNSAAPGLEPGDSSYNTSQIVPNPDQYLFWDDLHPTQTVHAELAQFALEQLMLPGEFNRDGHIDAADISVMEQALADPSGYQSAHSDLSSADLMSIEDVNGDKKFTDADLQALLVNLRNGKGSAKTVPEPTTVMLLLLSLPAMLIARQRHAIAARQPNRKRKSLAN
jgi:thermolabile hemolysin